MKTKNYFTTGLVTIAAFISLAVILLWIIAIGEMNRLVALIGAGYALCCFTFLVIQLVAFVKTHVDYDRSIEQPKFDILVSEEKEWASQTSNS